MAQQASEPRLSLPRPADSEKALIYDPQFAAKAEEDLRSGCALEQCRLRLLGVIQKYGAVGLRATAFKW